MTNPVLFWGMILIFSCFISPYTLVFAQNITSIISQSQFDEMLKHRNDPFCFANVSYTYDSFVDAANIFGEFGTTGDNETRKREVAAFFGFTSHLTTAGGPNSTDGPYAWGYCFLPQEQPNPLIQCDTRTSQQWPCVPGQRYYSRGPMQLSYNYNYGPAGQAIGIDLLRNPDLVATNATIAFKTAIWSWMTPSPPNPSCHEVITGQWTPSMADLAAGRAPGYGEIINIVRGSTECGQGESNEEMLDSIGFYKKYCDMFEIGYGNNLDCAYIRTNLFPRVSIQLISCTLSVINNLVYQ